MLTWNAYYEDFNGRRISTFNIFEHTAFFDGCVKAAKKCTTKEDFSEMVRREMMYYFWSKCEWEIILTSWPPTRPEVNFRDEKIDVYDQVRLNWDVFIDWLWENRKELKKKKAK